MNKKVDSLSNSARQNSFTNESARITLIDYQRWGHIGKHYNMTPRELDVAKLVCMGMDNRAISDSLHIREGTVKTHIRNIYRRLNVQNRIAMFLKFVYYAAQIAISGEKNGGLLPITEIPVTGHEKLAVSSKEAS